MRRATAWMLLVLGLIAAQPAAAADERCAGERVTLDLGDGGTDIEGTEGRDVILGTSSNEKIDGGGGDDVICGGGGDDKITGGSGRDELHGEGDDDTFRGPDLWLDIVVGGNGRRDIAYYAGSGAGIDLDMRRGRVQVDGAPSKGAIDGVELVGGTAYDDHLVGDGDRQRLVGGAGNDIIDGRGGEDELVGGDDVDLVTFAWADKPVVYDHDKERASVGRLDIEVFHFEAVVGTRFDDRLTGGNDIDERFLGEEGDDVIKGRGGHDTLEGGPDDDTLFPGPGDDTVDGGPNNPVTDNPVKVSVAHGDLVSYQNDKPVERPGVVSSFDFEAYLGVNGFYLDHPAGSSGVGDDLFEGIESIRGPQSGMSYIDGDDGPNIIIGGSVIDLLDGKGGNDLIFSLGGEDSLAGGPGDDYLDGGRPDADNDTDKVGGGPGNDTCLGARDDGSYYGEDCETTG